MGVTACVGVCLEVDFYLTDTIDTADNCLTAAVSIVDAYRESSLEAVDMDCGRGRQTLG